MVTIKIAAVGDLLMKSEIITSAKQAGKYNFHPIFAKVAPYLKKHHVTIGNLETTFSGKKWHEEASRRRTKCNCPNERRNPKTGAPMFSCPDELAPALKIAGFDVLTTANNHTMDGGATGLARTLSVLDRHGFKHTGTFRSLEESRRKLIVRVKGVNIGILAYTQGTNGIPVPKPWLVNRMERKRILADINHLKKKTDFLIACLHFGQEYRYAPSKSQKQWIQLLFKQGVNVILGAHPHVLHPVISAKVKDTDGHVRKRVAASSLGNFVSTRLKKNNDTTRGMILVLTITKNDQGVTDISKIGRIFTNVQRRKENGRTTFKVVQGH